MSFILDALKRADQERRQDGAPSIAIAHSIAPDEPLTDRRAYTMGLMWVGSALAVVVLAVWISVTLSTRLSIQALSDSPVTSVITAEIIDTPRNVTATPLPQPSTSAPTLDQTQAQATDPLPHPEISALYQAADTTNNTSKAVQRLYIPEVPEPALAPPRLSSDPRAHLLLSLTFHHPPSPGPRLQNRPSIKPHRRPPIPSRAPRSALCIKPLIPPITPAKPYSASIFLRFPSPRSHRPSLLKLSAPNPRPGHRSYWPHIYHRFTNCPGRYNKAYPAFTTGITTFTTAPIAGWC